MHGELAQKSTAGEINKCVGNSILQQNSTVFNDFLRQCKHTTVDSQKEWHPENGRCIEAIECSAGV